MEFLKKYFTCIPCMSYIRNKDFEELKKTVDDMKKNNTTQVNPLCDISRESIAIKKLDQKVEDQNIDVLTKIVFLKEEIQRLDKKVKDLEVTFNSSDHYCMIDNKLGGTTSDDSNSDNEIDYKNIIKDDNKVKEEETSIKTNTVHAV